MILGPGQDPPSTSPGRSPGPQRHSGGRRRTSPPCGSQARSVRSWLLSSTGRSRADGAWSDTRIHPSAPGQSRRQAGGSCPPPERDPGRYRLLLFRDRQPVQVPMRAWGRGCRPRPLSAFHRLRQLKHVPTEHLFAGAKPAGHFADHPPGPALLGTAPRPRHEPANRRLDAHDPGQPRNCQAGRCFRK